MADPQPIIEQRLRHALGAALGPDHAQTDPLVRPSGSAQFGDYQANVAMSLGKSLGKKPRDVAQAIVDHLDAEDLCEKVEIAGPGFINLYLHRAFIARQAAALSNDDRSGVPPMRPGEAQTVVVDYAGPNVAKEMHIGHLRSSVIGDAIVRVLEFQGHRVIRQNHIGDWGRQFGMLIEHLIEKQGGAAADASISDLNALYQEAQQRFDQDPEFAERARRRVVALQGGDERTLALWRQLVDRSEEHFQEVFDELGVSLSYNDTRGESFYNSLLPEVVTGLEKAGLLRTSQGAEVVFAEGFKGADGEPVPLIVRKSDGGYLYATTDLAAARFRVQELRADRVIYLTDARQSDHFKMVFWTLRAAGWAPPHVRLDHVPFGTVLGKDRKPFKTRTGGTVKLIDLLREAGERAAAVLAEKNPDLPQSDRDLIARVVGVGAVKYADLSNDRIKDYVFDWDRMLAFEGNTAPYLQNAYVRIRSIFRRGGIDPASVRGRPVTLREDPERQLALKLLQLPSAVESVAQSLEPHRLCAYLYELASLYHQFYEQCPVLSANEPGARESRLVLCDLAARVLERGLGLLGIGVVEQM